MPIDTSIATNMTQVDTGDVYQDVPDLPDGHWKFAVKAKTGATKPESGAYPMLTFEMTVTESLGDQDRTGAKIFQRAIFYPPSHKAYRMQRPTIVAFSEASGAQVDTSSLNESPPSWESLVPWVDAIEEQELEFWTTSKKDKNGQWQLNLHNSEPGQPLQMQPAEETDPEPEAKPVPKAAPVAKASAKSNGHSNGHKKAKR